MKTYPELFDKWRAEPSPGLYTTLRHRKNVEVRYDRTTEARRRLAGPRDVELVVPKMKP